jgi:hypothetical protein
MSVKIDEWKNLDATDRLEMSMSIPEVARAVVRQNRGAHRMLSAMVHALRENRKENPLPCSGESDQPMADALEKLLNDGIYY